MNSSSAAVEINEVSKRLGGSPILSGASASIERGRSYGLVGPNGAGKSVLFRLICGFMLPDEGTIEINDLYKPRGQTFPSFGMLIDGPGYVPSLSGYDNLISLARIRRVADKERVQTVMERFRLDPASNKPVRSYSLGMKQKLGLAQAVMEYQEVLVLDEPFNALDRSSVGVVTELLQEHVAGGGTIIMTSHHQVDIDELCDHVFEIDDGRLLHVR